MSEASPEIGDEQAHESEEDYENAADISKSDDAPGAGLSGGDGVDDEMDDEEVDEEEVDEDEDEDEEEEEEEEPRLKNARLTPHLGAVYRNGDATSSFLVAGDKMVCPAVHPP